MVDFEKMTLLFRGSPFWMNGGECDVYERVQPYVRYERQVDHSGEIPRDFGRGICDFQGMDGCLFVYAGDDWNAFEQKLTLITSDQ